MSSKTLFLAVVATLVVATSAQARDQIYITGSSTVYPFASEVAEVFGKTSGFKTPKVESTGSGGGIKLFCAGADENSPDIVNASRRIKQSELDTCAANGVKDVTEVVIGFDGIVVVNAKAGPKYTLTREQLYLAIGKMVPKDGKVVPNPYKKWSDIDPALPKEKIVVFGPASNHGTRDALVELVIAEACAKFPEVKALADDDRKIACAAVREDDGWVDVAENYTVTLQKLVSQPHAVGILTFSYLDQNGDKIKAATIDGKVATYDAIADGSYPLSRPLYFYVKDSHVGVIPGIKEYIAEFTSDKAWGKDGYLADKGLIASPDARRKSEAANAQALNDLKL